MIRKRDDNDKMATRMSSREVCQCVTHQGFCAANFQSHIPIEVITVSQSYYFYYITEAAIIFLTSIVYVASYLSVKLLKRLLFY